MNPYAPFTREDQLTNKFKALPAASASAVTDSLDLGGAGILGKVEFEFGHEALPALVDSKTVTLTIQDSADNVTFSTVFDVAALLSMGAGGNGTDPAFSTVKLPSTTKRYIRARASVTAAGGDNTAKKFYLKAKY